MRLLEAGWLVPREYKTAALLDCSLLLDPLLKTVTVLRIGEQESFGTAA